MVDNLEQQPPSGEQETGDKMRRNMTNSADIGGMALETVNVLVNRRSRRPTVLGWIALVFITYFSLCLLFPSEQQQSALPEPLDRDINPRFKEAKQQQPQVPGIKAGKRVYSEGKVELAMKLKESQKEMLEMLARKDVRKKAGPDKLSPSVNKPVKDGELPILEGIPFPDSDDAKKNKFILETHGRPDPKSFPVNYVEEPSLGCNEHTLLVFIVQSDASNMLGRQNIRNTWGIQGDKYDLDKGASWITMFVMGRAKTAEQSSTIADENEANGDILQGNFPDSPLETTRKFLLATQYLTQNLLTQNNCKPRFVMKTQDNIFHNMVPIIGWLQNKFPEDVSNLYLGRVARNIIPNRDKDDPMYVANGDYSGRFYPDLVVGPVYLFSTDAVLKVSYQTGKVTPIAQEDGFVGLLAQAAGLTPQYNDHFQMLQVRRKSARDMCAHRKTFFFFNVETYEHSTLYKRLKDSFLQTNCMDAKTHAKGQAKAKKEDF